MKAGAHEIESFTSIRRRLGWRFHALLLGFVAITASAALYFSPAYYFPICASSGAIGMMILRFWCFSRRAWFWITMVAAMALQVPLILASKDLASQWKWAFGFFFMLADCLVIDFTIRWVCPELRHSATRTDD